MRRIWRFTQEHAVEVLLTMLMMALVAMFVHAITDRGELRRRVNDVERECNLQGGQVEALRSALDDRTDALKRELDQRTQSMHREIVQVCDRMDQKFASLESMIQTLIRVLQDNGVGMYDYPRIEN